MTRINPNNLHNQDMESPHTGNLPMDSHRHLTGNRKHRMGNHRHRMGNHNGDSNLLMDNQRSHRKSAAAGP